MKCINERCEHYDPEWLHNCGNSVFAVLSDCPNYMTEKPLSYRWCADCGYRYADAWSDYCGPCREKPEKSNLKYKMTSNGGYSVFEGSAAKPEPEPTGNGEIVLFEVMQDLINRAQVGKEKYGTYLRTQNGRNALNDALQEALDLVMYLKQAIMEREKTCTCPTATINGRDNRFCEYYNPERQTCRYGEI